MSDPNRRTITDRLEVAGNELVERVKELAKDADNRRVVIRTQDDKELLSIPLTWGLAGGALAVVTGPVFAAMAAVGGALAKVRLDVERVADPGTTPTDVAGDPDGDQDEPTGHPS
ncbi:DUF4342 domain-containing protein [Ornithinimicrobium tianjinense]|uniref:DUF4342 domain-containing protein n=1 Tax=Ornithinimicrobium tianjinense TaxID=1195761 RepID=A0A917BKW9_9MICO|nr:DUF4342 domain-containing protein [Ornithinimicrobium tianjinense]GGF47243.1 hypothetical protein GCM10011366_13770 [Ornithinimicrobium tianjinense]